MRAVLTPMLPYLTQSDYYLRTVGIYQSSLLNPESVLLKMRGHYRQPGVPLTALSQPNLD